jgi:hypothetical protein
MLEFPLVGLRMFDDLFHLIQLLDHDYREDPGERVHAFGCRKCALSLGLSAFKVQILQILREIDFALGDPVEKNRRP